MSISRKARAKLANQIAKKLRDMPPRKPCPYAGKLLLTNKSECGTCGDPLVRLFRLSPPDKGTLH